MKKIAFIVMSVCALLNPLNAESGRVFWDINGDSRMGSEEVIYALQSTAEIRTDNKVGLSDAIYVLKILSGSEGVVEETGMFKAYRADALQQLQITAKDESRYLSEFNEYTTTLSDRLPNVCISSPVPGVKLDISVSQDKRYFKLTASHENINGFVWSLDSNLIFAENDVIIPDGIRTYGLNADEAFKVYREDVIQQLLNVQRIEESYLSEYNSYTNDLSDELYRRFNPFVHIEVLKATKDYFKLKGTHDKLPGYIWTLDSNWVFTENNVVIPEGIRGYGLTPTEAFDVRRADVISELDNIYRLEMNYLPYYDTFADSLTALKYKPDMPNVHIEFLVITDRYFKIGGTHDYAPGYVWTFDSDMVLKENDNILFLDYASTDCDRYFSIEFSLRQFLANLSFVERNSSFYEYNRYTDNLSDLGLDKMFCNGFSWCPGIVITIELSNNGQSYIAKATHPILGHILTINENWELREDDYLLCGDINSTDYDPYFKQQLGNIAKNEDTYYYEHNGYTDNLSEIGGGIPCCASWCPEVTVTIEVSNTGQSYIAKATLPVLNYVWTINEKIELVKVPK